MLTKKTQSFLLPLTKVTLISDADEDGLHDTEVVIGDEVLLVIKGDDIDSFKSRLIALCNVYRI